MPDFLKSTSNEINILAGVFTVVSLSVMVGWLLAFPPLTFSLPGVRPVSLVGAMLFLLSAGGLLATRDYLQTHNRRKKLIAQSLAIVICTLSAMLIAHDVLDLTWVFYPADTILKFGAMSSGTLTGFLFSGLALLILTSNASKNGEIVFLTLVIGVVASGLLGFFGQLSPWIVDLFQISLASSTGIVLLGVCIYRLAAASKWLNRSPNTREDSKISLIGGLIMMGFGVAISLVVVVLFFSHVEQLLASHLSNRLANDVRRFEDVLDQRVASLVTQRKNLPLFLTQFETDVAPAPDEQRLFETALAEMLSGQISAIALFDGKGRLLAHQGTFQSTQDFSVPLNLAYPATLVWKDQFLLRIQIPALESNRVLGSYIIESPLPLVSKILYDVSYLGESAEPVICAAATTGMQCVPTRFTGRVIKIPRSIQGKPLPMDYALRGFSGTISTLDYRGIPVVAAYRPLPRLNLGMVIKMDAEELYRPQRVQAQKMVPIFIGLLFISFMLLRWQVVPLVHKLGDAELRTRLVIDNLLDALITVDRRGIIISANSATTHIFGYDGSEIVGQSVKTLLPKNADYSHDAEFLDFKNVLDSSGSRSPVQILAQHKNGSSFPVEVLISKILSDGQTVFIAMIRDVSERLKQNQQMALAARVINNTKAGVLVADYNKVVKSVNPAFTALLGYSEAQIVGYSLTLIQKNISDPPTLQWMEQMWMGLEATGHWQGEIQGKGKSGEPYMVTLNMTSTRDAAGEPSDYIGVFTDIRETKQSEERIYHLAHYDTLTNLPNRLAFYDRLNQAIAYAGRNDLSLGILFLDVDRFKDVNDTLGHGVGDMVLRMVAQRIQRCLRASDMVSRLGGDEFVILLEDLPVERDTSLVAQKILTAITEKYEVAHQEFHLSASMGITVYPMDGKNSEDLVKNADVAMYRAKESGRNNFQFYTTDMNLQALERLELQNSLYRALERGEFFLHYQPQVDTQTGEIRSVEALLRWKHPQRGMVSPTDFIPIAEDKGLIVPIGEWVLREACRQTAIWRGAGFDLSLAVNLSARQFRQENLIGVVQQILSESGIAPENLELELTESYIMDNPEAAIKILRELSDTGVQLSVDDFGTGYSSLSYLKRFPIDTLKIDQSFVQEVAIDPDSAAIVTAVIAMAAALRLKVVAEGVETTEQSQFLATHGCTRMQGYLFSRPLPPEDLTKLLQLTATDNASRWKA